MVTITMSDETDHTLTQEDGSETCNCETPFCVCPQSGPTQYESAFGNGRWKLTSHDLRTLGHHTGSLSSGSFCTPLSDPDLPPVGDIP